MKRPQCNTEQLEHGCARLGIPLSGAQAGQLRRHLELLSKWNRRLNLTAINGVDDMVVRHLLDSLAIAPFVRGRSFLDIGSGGGFPGIPLAVVLPHLEVTLLDSRARRIEFLRHASATLGLGNVTLAARRVENYRPREKFDTLATRAFASLEHTLKATAGLQRRGCRLLAMKGRMPGAEIERLAPPMRERLITNLAVKKLNVPFLPAERHLVIIEF